MQQVVVHPVRPAEHTCANVDIILITNHHPRSTHLDAVAHIAEGELVYPGRPLASSVTPGGVHHGSTVAFGEGIVTRGVLLDLAADGPLAEGHGVTATDLEEAERRQGVRVEEGDALVVRCGWDFTPDPTKRSPGMSVNAVRWMHDRGVSLYVGDIGDAFPPLDPQVAFPMHAVGLTRLGLPLVDAANVEDLVAVCRELGRYSFMLVAAPPRIANLTGVPVNPVAIF
ncbi:cyclase family protein [Nitriliruptor alkaliphilus]|uniref:cyclase family protein n=1 Tax=Nitriliruptor alkaliphilus TaxID=427918 RepID=UPI001B7FFA7A|nr:cyclase family protein [Nitriliruptor alkaliphilus]